MTIHDHIYNFLRDGQYRIGQYTAMIDNLEDEGSVLYHKYFRARLEISVFMDILYEGMWPIDNGYNHIQIPADWTEVEILSEIQYLRYYYGMNEIPWITFTGHYPKIEQSTGGGSPGSGNQPITGLPGQFVSFNASGQQFAEDFNPYGGHLDETIEEYFQDRV